MKNKIGQKLINKTKTFSLFFKGSKLMHLGPSVYLYYYKIVLLKQYLIKLKLNTLDTNYTMATVTTAYNFVHIIYPHWPVLPTFIMRYMTPIFSS